MSRRAARGRRIKACPGPNLVWVFAATALSCSASLDLLAILGMLAQYCAKVMPKN